MEDNFKDLASAKIDEVDMNDVAGGSGLADELLNKYGRKDPPFAPKKRNDWTKSTGGDSFNQKMDEMIENYRNPTSN